MSYATLLLDPSAWDLLVDSSGNIAVAQAPYAFAQDVATAQRTVLGECVFNTTLGLPFFADAATTQVPLSLLQAQLVAAALTVPGVVSAQAVITSFLNGTLKGYTKFIDVNGQANGVSF